MATVNKDFKIKSGLIVEGTTGTINGNNILTETASDEYIIDLIGGETLVTSVNSTQLEVVAGELSVKSGVFDDAGAAASAETAANSYTDGEITTALTTAQGYADDAQANAQDYADGLATNYDAAGSATTAYNNAVTYADGLATNYDAAGAADTAEGNANEYTDTALEDYTTTANLDTTVGGYGYLKSADLGDYATQTYVNDAVDALVDGAPGLLDTLNEIAAAINDDANYATTMTTALAGKQNNLTAGSNIDITSDTISVTGLDTDDVSEGTNLYFTDQRALDATSTAYDSAGSASTAEQNAKDYADGLASNYDASGSASTAESNAATYTDNAINALDTDDIEEGSSNLYYTDSRAKDAAAALLTGATLTNIAITGTASNLIITAENGVADSDTDDLAEGSENLYFTDERAIDAVSGADIYPNAVILSNVAKQVATSTLRATAGTHVGVAFAKADYRSAEFLVKVAYGDHTEISKVLLTLDVNDNISITEYGIVGTNGSGMTVSAGISGTDVQLLVTTANNNTTVTVVGTLLI